MSQPVRVRFAPSPTGSLHIGGARTALYNYLFAKHHGGDFILRIEDTDQARSTEEALRAQIRDLQWLGLDWDEGPDPKTLVDQGAHGPYRQSQRLDIYQAIAAQWLETGLAYHCFLTDEEITAQKEAAMAAGQPYQLQSPYRDLSLADAQTRLAAGEKATVRFRCDATQSAYVFEDMVRGSVTLPSHMVGDFVILRSCGMPVYNFCCAVDDAKMGITHVFRGEEHLPNTLRQLMIYDALGVTPPAFGHLSIILGEDKKKLSKRQGAVSCDAFRAEGFLPEGLLNAMALLGWSSKTKEEIFTKQQLIDAFSPKHLNAAAPIFDRQKLAWINANHIRQLSDSALFELVRPLLQQANCQWPQETWWEMGITQLLRTELVVLHDMVTAMQRYLATTPWQPMADTQEAMAWPETHAVVTMWLSFLEACDVPYPTHEMVVDWLKAIQKALDVKGKTLFMPLRIAVLGVSQGADVRKAAPLIATEVLQERAKACLTAMQAVQT